MEPPAAPLGRRSLPQHPVMGPCVVCCAARYMATVEECVAKLPGVFLLPAIGQPQFYQVLKAASVVVNSSLSEGMCGSILEAMALKVPVVARDIPGNVALVTHGVPLSPDACLPAPCAPRLVGGGPAALLPAASGCHPCAACRWPRTRTACAAGCVAVGRQCRRLCLRHAACGQPVQTDHHNHSTVSPPPHPGPDPAACSLVFVFDRKLASCSPLLPSLSPRRNPSCPAPNPTPAVGMGTGTAARRATGLSGAGSSRPRTRS